jgi:hypothetical protein
MLYFKTMKSRNLAILKFKKLNFLYRGTITALLPLMVTLIIDHSYFAFTPHYSKNQKVYV